MTEADPSKETPFFHDAFISYSRKDTPFAATIERALKRYSPPRDLPAPHRRLDVFRDTEDFTGTEYFTSVERHLQASRKLIVICSPNARESKFVNDEIRRFASSHATADIISILIAGIPNNEAKPNEILEMAFPEALVERLQVPLASDYRDFNPKSDHPTSGNYRRAWFKLLADIYGLSRAEVEQREQRRKVRRRIQWSSAAAVILSAIGVSLYVADSQRRDAQSNGLAEQAIQLSDGDPEHALELARQALEQSTTKLSIAALRVALAKMPDLLIPLSFPPRAHEGDYRPPAAIAFAPDERQLAIADAKPRVLDLETGRTTVNIVGEGTLAAHLRFSPDGLWLAAIDDKHNTVLLDAATGKPAGKMAGELNWRQPSTAGAEPAVLLLDKSVQVGEVDNTGSWRPLRTVTPVDYVRPGEEAFAFPAHLLSPDGHKFASLATQDGSRDSRLTVTDLDTDQQVSRQFQTPAGLNKLSWSQDGSKIVAASLSGFAIVESDGLQSLLQQDSGNEITVEDVSFSPDGKLLAATDRRGATALWDIKQRKKATELSGSTTARAYDPVFSPDGHLLSVRFSDDRVYLFPIDAGMAAFDVSLAPEPVAIFDPIWGGAKAATFTSDGGALIIEYENHRLAVWKTQRWRPEHRLPLKYGTQYDAGKPEGLKTIGVSADHSVIGVERAGGSSGWNVESGREVTLKANALKPLDKIMISEVGDLELRNAVSDETTVYLVDRSTERQRYPLRHNAEVMSKTFSPDGACILTTSRFFMASGGPPDRADVARLWDTETGTLLREWHFGYGNPDSAFFAAGDRIVVLSAGDGFVFQTPLCGSLDDLRPLATPERAFAVHPNRLGDENLGSQPQPPRIASPSEPEIPPPSPSQALLAPQTTAASSGAPERAAETSSPIVPSFPCSGKLSAVETLICHDAELAGLDVEVAQAYRNKIQDLQGKARQQLIAAQRAWLRQRADCAGKGDLKPCVEEAYRRRREALALE